MPPIVLRDAVADLPIPDPALLREAAARGGAGHDALALRVPALRSVEARQPVRAAPAPARLRVVAWNAERCTDVEAAAALLRRAGAGLALLSEMDHGMARSNNRHTTRDLARALGDAGHCYGVEFVELGPGVGRELERFAGAANAAALHGNGIVSTLPFRDPFMVRLDPGGAWFDLGWHHPRLGGRIAVGATVDLARGPLAVVSVHLENRSTPSERADAMGRLLAAIPPGAAVVAGDLNTAALPDPAAEPGPGWLLRPEAREPLFGAMRDAGFDWTDCNAPDPTRRFIADGRPAPRMQRVDWLFTRGVAASNPTTWAAVGEDGRPLSDHELIAVDIA